MRVAPWFGFAHHAPPSTDRWWYVPQELPRQHRPQTTSEPAARMTRTTAWHTRATLTGRKRLFTCTSQACNTAALRKTPRADGPGR